MILKNYWKWLNVCQQYLAIVPGNNNDLVVNAGLLNLSGNSVSIVATYGGDWQSSVYSTYSAKNRCINDIDVIIGTGNNEYTESSYNIANDITSSLDNVSHTLSYGNDTNYKRTITITGTNNTGDSVTITEIGITKSIYTTKNNTTTDTILFAICQLDSPLEVANGDSFTITLNWIEA